MKKYVIIILICTILIVGLFLIFNCPASNPKPTIEIYSAEELSKIGVDPKYPLDGDYALLEDIMLDSTYVPIAPNSAAPFTGSFDGKGKTVTANWSGENYSIFRYVDGAAIKCMDIYVTGSELRAPLVYFAFDSTFADITIDGSITKQSYQIGGMVWASSGCTFKNIDSSVDMILTNISFDKYNILGGIVCQITAESDTLAWSNHVYANKFINCSYDGRISVDLNKATYTGASGTSLWVGNLYGATAYNSPIIYFGVYVKGCTANGVYAITGSLDTGSVAQYSFIDQNGEVHATYNPSSKGASSKTEPDIVRYGRTHQNVQLTEDHCLFIKESYGYYGASGNETDAGEHLWSVVKITPLAIIILSLTIAISFVFILIFCLKKRCKKTCR